MLESLKRRNIPAQFHSQRLGLGSSCSSVLLLVVASSLKDWDKYKESNTGKWVFDLQ